MRLREIYFIYAFLSEGGEILYVGQTGDISIREKTLRKSHERLRSARFKILRKVSFERRLHVEAQIIHSLAKRGQCVLNKRKLTGRPCGSSPTIRFTVHEPKMNVNVQLNQAELSFLDSLCDARNMGRGPYLRLLIQDRMRALNSKKQRAEGITSANAGS
jgi:hypothetical protein